MNSEIELKILDVRQRLGARDMFLGSPASGEDLKYLIASVRAEFSASLPEQYLDFLRRFDGLSSGGVFIYSSRPLVLNDGESYSHDFIELNKNFRDLEFMRDFLVFGESDQDAYMLDLVFGRFQVRDRQVFDNVFEEFDCFDGLLDFMVGLVLERA